MPISPMSPSQQHLDPSRSSSISQPDDMDPEEDRRRSTDESRPHKLDLYSIPVFLLEVIILVGLAFVAYFIHFEYRHEPIVSGFYCDDISLRQTFIETKLIQQFTRPDNELVVYVLLLAVPIVFIVFCELVNSLFGSLKFRQIRALCACCKLHSITRRTIRFSGAYALGLLIVLISGNILAETSGHLRPYFAQECPQLYGECGFTNASEPKTTPRSNLQGVPMYRADSVPPMAMAQTINDTGAGTSNFKPLSPPISGAIPNSNIQTITTTDESGSRYKRDDVGIKRLIERKWINLSGANLTGECSFEGDVVQTRKFEQLAMSWPSIPAAMITYACLFIACYLSFVGTARPFRLITCILVMVLLLSATMFDRWLVTVHYNNWSDVVAGSVLALFVVVLVIYVYLNLFRDSHYYENQKIYKRQLTNQNSFKGYNNATIEGQYSLDKTDTRGVDGQNGDTGGSITNDELAMRYFQIPRANYRGAPRPLSSMNQM